MLTVQCEFDGAITEDDVGTAIKELFASDGWKSIQEDYEAGKYSVEESSARQYALVSADEETIKDFVLSVVVVRYDFDQFVNYCRGEGVRLVVVSSGLDLYIRPTMEMLGFDDIDMYSGRAAFTGSEGIRVEYADPSGAAIARGLKEAYAKRFRSQGDTLIYVGSDLSDVGAAQEADFVIARSRLAERLDELGQPHYTFETFGDVGRSVIEIKGKLGV